jgi:hypothetical protein
VPYLSVTDDTPGQLHYSFVAKSTDITFFATVNLPPNSNNGFAYKIAGATYWYDKRVKLFDGFHEIVFGVNRGLKIGKQYTLKIVSNNPGLRFDRLRIHGAEFVRGNAEVTPSKNPPFDLFRGDFIYAQACVRCHGETADYNRLNSTRTINYIQSQTVALSMPGVEERFCVGTCASEVANYIFYALYGNPLPK